MSAWSSTSRWPILSRLTCIVSVGFRIYAAFFPSRIQLTSCGLTFCLGRTGRAGKQGVAITFLTNDDDEVMCVYFFRPISVLCPIGAQPVLFISILVQTNYHHDSYIPHIPFDTPSFIISTYLVIARIDLLTFRFCPDRYDLKQGTPDAFWTFPVRPIADSDGIGNRDIEESSIESAYRACESLGGSAQGLEGDEEKEGRRGPGLGDSSTYLYCIWGKLACRRRTITLPRQSVVNKTTRTMNERSCCAGILGMCRSSRFPKMKRRRWDTVGTPCSRKHRKTRVSTRNSRINSPRPLLRHPCFVASYSRVSRNWSLLTTC